MIPEIVITCGTSIYRAGDVTVAQFRKYVDTMSKNNTHTISDVMFFDKKILQDYFDGAFSIQEIGQIDAIEFLETIKTIHFIMQEIVMEKMANVIEIQQVEKEKSAFDEYDAANGYEEEEPQEELSQWDACREITDRYVKLAIRLLNNSYSQCMRESIVSLLDYLKFEINTMNENQ